MERALYGPDGFYRREQPAQHFRTSSHISAQFGGALLRLAARVAGELETAEMTVVDVGAGSGELLAVLANKAPPAWRLVGVELRPRPGGLPDRVEWTQECEYGIRGLVIANEWLDNVAIDVAELTAHGWREQLVDAAGTTTIGGELTPEQSQWLADWWPASARAGELAELGLQRDQAWSDLASRLEAGVMVAIDYALNPEHHGSGTLTGYRNGRQVPPVPDGSCDLTAHVHFASVAAAGARAGLAGTAITTQRDALLELGVDGSRPAAELATRDPRGYVEALAAAGSASELLDPDGLGGFQWLIQTRRVRALAARG